MIKRILRRLKIWPLRLTARLYLATGYHKVSSLHSMLGESVDFDKDVWIIGNGPSVRYEDLDRIHRSGAITVVANRFHLAYGSTILRPTVVVSSDELVIEEFGQEIIQENRESYVAFAVDNIFTSDLKANLFLRLYSKVKLKRSKVNAFYNGGGSLFLGIQLLYSYGFRNFILYGVDHSFSYEDVSGKARGDGNHFIRGYRSGKLWNPPRMSQIESTFNRLDILLKKDGGRIRNASRNSKLPYILKVDFEEIL